MSIENVEDRVYKNLKGFHGLGINIDAIGIALSSNVHVNSEIKSTKWFRKNYGIMMVTEGTIFFESLSTGTIQLGEGTIFLLTPGNWFRYGAQEGKSWGQCWIALSGTNMREYFGPKLFDAQPCYFMADDPEYIKTIYLKMTESVEKQDTFSALNAAMELIYYLEIKRNSSESEVSILDELINRIIKFPERQYDFDKEASNLSISHIYFRKLFKTETGFPPAKYLAKARIQKACDLLRRGEMVKMVSRIVGYDDPLYFSKVFKRFMKCSPRNFINSFH